MRPLACLLACLHGLLALYGAYLLLVAGVIMGLGCCMGALILDREGWCERPRWALMHQGLRTILRPWGCQDLAGSSELSVSVALVLVLWSWEADTSPSLVLSLLLGVMLQTP